MIIERVLREGGMSSRGAIVVAHPDDESLWFAGLMLQWPISWTCICCSIPERDPVRAWRFYDACEILGATPKLIPLEEANVALPVRRDAIGILDGELGQYDLLVTHSAAGEYGHVQHKHLHEHLTTMWPDKTACGLYGVTQQADSPWGDIITCSLTDDQYARKLLAIDAYRDIHPRLKIPTSLQLRRAFEEKFDLRVELYTGPE